MNLNKLLLTPFSENAVLYRSNCRKTDRHEVKPHLKNKNQEQKDSRGKIHLGSMNDLASEILPEHQDARQYSERFYPRIISLVVIPNRKENEEIYSQFGSYKEGELIIQSNFKMYTLDEKRNIAFDIIKFRNEFWKVRQTAYAKSPNFYTAKLEIINQDVFYEDGLIIYRNW